jgi:hypothetical protein
VNPAAAKRAAGPQPVPPRNCDVAPELPSNREAERNILGAILLDASYLKVAAAIVGTFDFQLPDHQQIFERMIVMQEHQIAIDLVTITEELQRAGKLETAGGAAYISQLADGQPRIANVAFYAQIVKDKSVLRSAIQTANALEQRALERTATVADIRPYAEQISRLTEPEQKETQDKGTSDMPEAVLDGRLGDLCQQRMTGFPLAYSWTALLAVASVLVPTPHPEPSRANIYACLVGDKGTGKSSAINCATRILGVCEPQVETTLAGSAEGLLEKMGDVYGERRLLSPDELGHLLTKAKIEGASFPFILNTAFYQEKVPLVAARAKKIDFHCCLSIVGGIVEENFENCFGSATTGGLWDRFLFGLAPNSFVYNFRPLEGGKENFEPCQVTVAPDVWDAKSEWLRNIPDLSPRAAEIAIRVAIISAAFSGRTILSARHLGPARELAGYQATVRKRLQPNPGENSDARCAFAILAALEKFSGWMLKRDVARKVHYERFGPSVFERSIASLEGAGEISVDRQKPIKLRRASS